MPRLFAPLTGAVVATLLVSGCAGLDSTEERVLSGGALGAGAGVIGTALTGGCITCGAVVGGVVGAAAGYVVDQLDDD